MSDPTMAELEALEKEVMSMVRHLRQHCLDDGYGIGEFGATMLEHVFNRLKTARRDALLEAADCAEREWRTGTIFDWLRARADEVK